MGRDLLSLPPVSADERIAYGTEPNLLEPDRSLKALRNRLQT